MGGRIVVRIRVIVFAGLMALLSACGSAPLQVAAPAPPPPPPPAMDPDSQCRADLASMHVDFQALSSFGEGRCSIANPVRLSAVPVPLNRSGVVSCDMARTIVQFEQNVLMPLARKYFGQDVKRINHFGTYDCRVRRTETAHNSSKSNLGTSKAGKLSEHAQGRAIDFAGVELADGRIVTVKDHWRGAGPSSTFLHELARQSCSVFNVVLTPNHDRLHQDHIHMDVGPNVLCGY
jgi:hypothetical protein